MIEAISNRIANFLKVRNIIQSDALPMYRYGIELSLSTILGIVLVVICGISFHMFWYTVLYYVTFCIIRQFAGGYHADTYIKCKVILVLATIMILGITKFLAFLNSYALIIHVLLLIFSLSTITWLSPLNNENKPLDVEQTKRCKYLSIVLSFGCALVSLPIYYWRVDCACIIALTLFLISFMQIVEFSRRGW